MPSLFGMNCPHFWVLFFTTCVDRILHVESGFFLRFKVWQDLDFLVVLFVFYIFAFEIFGKFLK